MAEEEEEEHACAILLDAARTSSTAPTAATVPTLAHGHSSPSAPARQPQRPGRYAGMGATLGAMGAVFALGCLSSNPKFSFSLSRRQGEELLIASKGPLGQEITVLEENACDLYPYLKFEVPRAIVTNNLANKGPDHAYEGIVYKTIDLGRGAGKELDREVFITVNATSNFYRPFSPRLNGMQGKYGSINLHSGSYVDLLYNFYDVETKRKLILPEFAMTWFDLDTGRYGKSVEYVIIGGFRSYHLTRHSEVQVEKQPDGRTKFTASTYGTGQDNPKDPMFLTQQQKNRAVTLLFGRTESISVTLGATPGRGPRFFTFVGRPSLLCAVTVQQNFKAPLPDLTFIPPMERGVICSEGEEFVTFSVFKGAKVKRGQLICTTKKNGQVIEHKAPFSGTVTQMQDRLKPGEKLDLRLSEKIIAVVRRPSLPPLPQNRITGLIGGGPGDDVHEHATFKRYLVNVGDSVSEGGDIALVQRRTGLELKIKSTGYGVVKARQEEMKPGMLLMSVEDGNLITLAKYPGLATGPDNIAAATVPNGGRGLIFRQYLTKRGDIIRVGDPIATVVNGNGQEEVIKALHGGVVSNLEALKEGAPMERMEGNTICTTGKFPPLPIGPGQAPFDSTGSTGSPRPMVVGAATSGTGEEPLPDQGLVQQEGLQFMKYYVQPKTIVATKDPIVQVKDENGVVNDLLAPRPGVVVAIQEGLKEGMVLGNVMQDRVLAVIDKLPILDISNTEDGSFAPQAENWKLRQMMVQPGDTVSKGDVIAILVNPLTLETRYVRAARSGDVTEILDKIKPGDDVEETTGDADLATIGLASGPGLGFREVAVDVPAGECDFEEWRVLEGTRVHVGDPIAVVRMPSGATSSGRRLMSDLTIPSPGTGTISYMADLQPQQKVNQRIASTTIAKVYLGWPWWLMLLFSLCGLCCCLGGLFQIMQKQPAYKPMPPPPPPEPKQEEPKPRTPTPEPQEPEGLRLDFDDRGTVRTVYCQYKPLGIKHTHSAPIIVRDFTCNSYSRQELGVQPNWKLTRVGDEELHDSTDFVAVNERLGHYLHPLPIWPLPLTFRKRPEDTQTHVYKFVERPLGLEFTNSAPIRVDRVQENSPAEALGVGTGWIVTKIGDADVETDNYREVLRYFKEGVSGLGDEGHRYSSSF